MSALDVASTLLLAVAAVTALTVATRGPFHAFCVLVATLPFESALAIKGPVTITPGYLALVASIAVTLAYRRRASLSGSFNSPATGVVVVYLGMAILSLVMTVIAPPPPSGGVTDLLRWRLSGGRSLVQAGLLVFSSSAFFVTVFVCSTPSRLRMATRLFVLVCTLAALYGLFQIVGVHYRVPLIGSYAASLVETPASLRPNATFAEAMNLGHFLAGGMPLLTALFLHHRQLRGSDRTAYGYGALPMIAVMAAALVFTIGRGAWLGTALALVTVVLSSEKEGKRRAAALAAAAAVIAVPVILSFGSGQAAVLTILNRFDFGAVGRSTEQRLWYFPLLMSLVRRYPLFGVGYGNYPLYQVFAFGLYGIAGAYGVFWEALVETGTLGFASLCALVVVSLASPLRAARNLPSEEWRPYLIGWAGSIVGLFVPYFFFGDRFNLYVWVALGLATATVRLSRQREST